MDFLDSWAVVKFLSSDRKPVFTSVLWSGWHMSKQKVCNWPSNKSDLRPHRDRLASSHKLGPQNHNQDTTAMIHLRPTSDWQVMLRDWLANDLRPGRDRLKLSMSLGKSWHQIKNRKLTRDRFTTAQGHRVKYDQPTKTCDKRIRLWVGSLANEINKFHDRF